MSLTDWPLYLAGLAAMLLSSFVTGRRFPVIREQLWRTAGAIALVWCFGKLYISNTGNYDPWEFNLFLDAAAMTAILWHPAGRMQAAIGWLFLAQIVCHVAYGGREVAGWPNDHLLYYTVLTVIAWAQLFVTGAWCVGLWFQNRVPRLGPLRNQMRRSSSHRSGGKEL